MCVCVCVCEFLTSSNIFYVINFYPHIFSLFIRLKIFSEFFITQSKKFKTAYFMYALAIVSSKRNYLYMNFINTEQRHRFLILNFPLKRKQPYS